MAVDSMVEWKCERCGKAFDPTVGAVGGVCSKCRKVVCRACIANIKSIKTQKTLCRDCAAA